MNHIYFTGLLSLILFGACNSSETEKPPVQETVTTTPVEAKGSPTVGYRFETFANIDSLGNTFGFGYDIYEGDKKLIHQTNIPGEPGIDGFVNEKEAALIAGVVIEKLKAGGGMPTIEHVELVDYGITLKK